MRIWAHVKKCMARRLSGPLHYAEKSTYVKRFWERSLTEMAMEIHLKALAPPDTVPSIALAKFN